MSVSSFEGAESCSKREISLSRLFSVFSVPSSGSNTSERLSFSRANRCWTTDSSSGNPLLTRESVMSLWYSSSIPLSAAFNLREASGRRLVKATVSASMAPSSSTRFWSSVVQTSCVGSGTGFGVLAGASVFCPDAGAVSAKAAQGRARLKQRNRETSREAFIQRRSVRLEYVRRSRNIPRDPSARQPLRM